MYRSAATHVFEKPPKTITTFEESSLKFEIKEFFTMCSTLYAEPDDIAESIKVELLSIDAKIDAVWWVTVNRYQSVGENCQFTVNLEAKPEGGSNVSKNFVFHVEAKIDDIQCFGPNTLKATTDGKWTFYSVTSIPANSNTQPAKTLEAVLKSKGSLVIDFKLTVVHEAKGSPTCKLYNPTAMRNEIIANHSNMLGDSTFSDFTFIVQGKQFKVHKVVLAAASEVCAKLFITKMAESEKNECTVTHLDPTAFEHMLRFIYSGKLPETFNAKMARDLYEAAHYYDLKTLKQVCEPEVFVGLNDDNAFELYKWAQIYELEELKKEALVIIKRDLLKIIFPLENEALPLDTTLDKILEILQQKTNRSIGTDDP